MQTGTQLLTGFLLTVAFQPTFRALADWQKALYLVVVSLAVVSTVVALMPVALHRALFRRRAMAELVMGGPHAADRARLHGRSRSSARRARLQRRAGVPGAIAAAVLGAALVGGLWLALPQRLRERTAPLRIAFA